MGNLKKELEAEGRESTIAPDPVAILANAGAGGDDAVSVGADAGGGAGGEGYAADGLVGNEGAGAGRAVEGALGIEIAGLPGLDNLKGKSKRGGWG